MLRNIAKRTKSYTLSNLPRVSGCDPLILCFHTVNDFQKRSGYVSSFRSQPLPVFESQLRWLNGFCDFVSLNEVVDKLGSPNSGRQKVALTFDDGYRDNLHAVLPVIEAYEAPVTLFVATDYISGNKLPWWDFMDWAMENEFFCDIENGGVRKGNMSGADVALQRALFRRVCRDGKQLRRDDLIKRLVDESQCLEENDLMNTEELARFANHPLTSLGAHTHSHFNTALLTPDELISDLQLNLRCLKSTTDQKIEHCAYPYGDNSQINVKSVDCFQELGLTAAFSTKPECVSKSKSIYELPRMIVSPRGSLIDFKASIKTLLLKNRFSNQAKTH